MNELPIHNNFAPGIVIPVGPGDFRLNNLNLVLETIDKQIYEPVEIVIVCDGWTPEPGDIKYPESIFTHIIGTEKHEPGKEQPRNIGVRYLSENCNYVWFLDSDCLVLPETLHEFAKAENYDSIPKVLIGPYEWVNEEPWIRKELYNDPRWPMFNKSSGYNFRGDLGVALGCFSGNLIWPIDEFKRVGGFWNEIHTGRCEDGELGIRASAMGVPMTLVKTARAFHMGAMGGHGDPKILEKNARDVPMINERHPYVEDQGIIVVDEDGKRFNQFCANCGESINTLLIWKHREECNNKEYN